MSNTLEIIKLAVHMTVRSDRLTNKLSTSLSITCCMCIASFAKLCTLKNLHRHLDALVLLLSEMTPHSTIRWQYLS